MESERNEKPCDYCGEESAQVTIPNPNMWDEDKPTWNVCVTCKKIISEQQKLSFGMILGERENPVAEKMSKKLILESKKEIDKLSYESGKEVYSGFL